MLLAAASAMAEELVLEGTFTQGGLVIGRTDPAARVTVDGRPVRVSDSGVFLIGFGRDAPARTSIRVIHGDGRAIDRTIGVTARKYDVQRIDGLPAKQVTPNARALKRIQTERTQINKVRAEDTARTFFAAGFVWPTRGRLSGVFGSQRILNGVPRQPHNGVDVAAPEGTPVKAPADGIVALAQQDMFFTGKTVMIDHGHGLISVFAHMSAIEVKPGQRIAKGEPIGKVGKTGRATGSHLHWGVTLFKTHLDPQLLAGPMPLN